MEYEKQDIELAVIPIFDGGNGLFPWRIFSLKPFKPSMSVWVLETFHDSLWFLVTGRVEVGLKYDDINKNKPETI